MEIRCWCSDRCFKYIKDIILFLLICGTLYGINPDLILPTKSIEEIFVSSDSSITPSPLQTGNSTTSLFPFIFIFLSSYVGGEISNALFLPKVLGMIISGIIVRNTTSLCFNPLLSSLLRNVALTTILIEGGLGLDPSVIAKSSGLCIRLCFIPLVTDTIVMGFLGHYFLSLPYAWSFMLGFILSAACAAIVVPQMMMLTKKGLGVAKGIPSIVLAAASMDDVIAIAGFGVMLGFAFDPSREVIGELTSMKIWDFSKGPVEILLGIAIGFFYGTFIGLLPLEAFIPEELTEEKSLQIKLTRLSLLVFGGLTSVFVSEQFNLGGIGPLSALTMAFFSGLKFRKVGLDKDLSDSVDVLWVVTKPFLFGLIGAEVDLTSESFDSSSRTLTALALVVGGMIIRVVATYISLLGGHLSWREKIYISLAWLSKAAVQATVAPIALDVARKKGGLIEQEYGRTIILVSVIAILLSVPIGMFSMSFLAEKCLNEPPPPYQEEDERRTQREPGHPPSPLPHLREIFTIPSSPIRSNQTGRSDGFRNS